MVVQDIGQRTRTLRHNFNDRLVHDPSGRYHSYLSWVAAHSISFFWISGPSFSINSFTTSLVFAWFSGSCSPSRALRYLLHVSSNGGTGSFGSLCWDANVFPMIVLETLSMTVAIRVVGNAGYRFGVILKAELGKTCAWCSAGGISGTTAFCTNKH